MKGYLFLIIAIILETIGTSLLKVSDQFTKLFPSLGAIIAYIGCFYILSLSLKTIPIGIAYLIFPSVQGSVYKRTILILLSV